MSTAEHPYTQMKKQRVKMKFILPCHWYFTCFKVDIEALALMGALRQSLEDLEVAWSFRRNCADMWVGVGFINNLEPEWLQL